MEIYQIVKGMLKDKVQAVVGTIQTNISSITGSAKPLPPAPPTDENKGP